MALFLSVVLASLLIQPSVALAEFGTGDGQFKNPMDVAVDSSGNVYVSDSFNYRIQKFDSEGGFLTKWGETHPIYGHPVEGSGNGAFNFPLGIAIDSSGSVFVADNNNERIQKFTSEGVWLASWNSYDTNELTNSFSKPSDVAVDSSGNVFVLDTGWWPTPEYRIVKLDNEGGFLTRWGLDGTDDGQIKTPTGIAVDSSGNVYVIDWWTDTSGWPFVNHYRIQKFDSDGVWVSTWDYEDGSANDQFSSPQRIAVDSSGNIYVADTFNHRIQKFDNDGAWDATWGSEGDGDGQFLHPQGIVVDSSGNIYVADTGNHRIQKLDSDGQFIDYIPTLNQPPIADAGIEQTVIVDETVTFDGSGSSDSDGSIVSYEWHFGDSVIGSGDTTAHIYSSDGIYTVELTVIDDDGATDTDTTTVTVQTPEEAIQDLISDVEGMNLAKGAENSLTSKLEAAIRSLSRDQKNVATNQLYAFINEIEAKRGKEITNTQADELTAKAQRVIDNI
jgi:streptogramin lyase